MFGGLFMPDITLEGVVYHVPYRSSKDRIHSRVFIDEKDHEKLDAWWRENHIDTKLEKLPHPILHKPCPQIQAKSTAKNIKNGTQVTITIDVVTRMKSGKSHIGLKTLSIKSR